MRHICVTMSTGLFVLLSFAPALPASDACPGLSDCTPLEVFDAHYVPRPLDAAAVLRDLNEERARHGLAVLRDDPQLDALARSHAVDMIDRRYFAHESLDGRSPFERMHAAGIRYDYAGENIAHNSDGERANEALWDSPPHRANRLDAHFAHVGIVALATDGAGELIVEDYTD